MEEKSFVFVQHVLYVFALHLQNIQEKKEILAISSYSDSIAFPYYILDDLLIVKLSIFLF